MCRPFRPLLFCFLARPVAGHPGFSRPFGAPAPWAIHISALRAFVRATGLVFYQSIQYAVG